MFDRIKDTLRNLRNYSAKETDSLPRQAFLVNSVSSALPYTGSASFGSIALISSIPQPTAPYHDAPPAYTQQPLPSLAAKFCSSSAAGEDEYDFLRIFDIVFVIDDSGSMYGSSWRETREALAAITSICTERDSDGIDIYFLNHQDKPEFKNITSRNMVNKIFKAVRPEGSTPTGERLDHILQQYLHDLERDPTMKPVNIIVITDGELSDDVESPIIATAKKLDKLNAPAWQVGIQFFQVGKSHHADKHLKQLDDEIRKISGDPELRDIVDTVAFTDAGGAKLTDEGILKVVLGSVNRRWDRRSEGLHL